jgi:ADP-ribose pyrophosphatase YjhB (NUDIX family)/predicted transcriptional regulator
MLANKVQFNVLYKLRHADSLRFSELMRGTSMESDVFKFHIRKLQKLGFVQKNEVGSYELTSQGKEFANDLRGDDIVRKQAIKLSLLLFVTHPTRPNLLLCQERTRQPYRGMWSVIGGPACWGEDFAETAAQELIKQTGLSANLRVVGFFRQLDYLSGQESAIEDKLFVVLVGGATSDDMIRQWQSGDNAWLRLEELQARPHFESIDAVAAMLSSEEQYGCGKSVYDTARY